MISTSSQLTMNCDMGSPVPLRDIGWWDTPLSDLSEDVGSKLSSNWWGWRETERCPPLWEDRWGGTELGVSRKGAEWCAWWLREPGVSRDWWKELALPPALTAFFNLSNPPLTSWNTIPAHVHIYVVDNRLSGEILNWWELINACFLLS